MLVEFIYIDFSLLVKANCRFWTLESHSPVCMCTVQVLHYKDVKNKFLIKKFFQSSPHDYGTIKSLTAPSSTYSSLTYVLTFLDPLQFDNTNCQKIVSAWRDFCIFFCFAQKEV